MLLRILHLSTFVGLALSLQCYICGDNDLGEFDECKTQFQYDCTAYAQKFGPDEKVYCRTIRQRAPNNTYTIMKECIAESQHYEKYPEKAYSVDEECDLVEVDGQEVAYCLCRQQSLCNQKPISEQFMAFEQKHPELFENEETESLPEAPDVRAAPAVVSAAFGTPQLQPQPILPVNDPRFSQSSDGSSVELLREKLPSRLESEEDGQMLRNIDPKEMEQLLVSQGKLLPVKESALPGRIDVPAAPGVPKGSSGYLFSSSAIDGRPIPGKKMREEEREPPLPAPVLDRIPISTLKCAQCGQGKLANENTDCDSVIVNCQGIDTHCYTRQILMGPGENAVEKMCVTKADLENQYGREVNLDGCSMDSNGKVRYCVCGSNECNKASAIEQMQQRLPPVNRSPPRPVAELPENARIPATAAKEVPDFGSARAPIQFRESLMPIQPVNNQPPPKEISEKEMELLRENSVHQATSPITPMKPKNNKVGEASVHCMVCNENGLTDPTTDCRSPVTVDCGAQVSSDEEFLCMTRQTELATGVFNLEKGCTTASVFAADFPEEKMEEGCGSAFENHINYCICRGDLCNKPSLLDQTQEMGLEEPKISPTTTTTAASPPRQWGGPVQRGPVTNNVDVDEQLTELMKGTAQETENEMSDEDREIAERQKKWREVELTASASQYSVLCTISSTVLMWFIF